MSNLISIDELRFIAIIDSLCEYIRKDFDSKPDTITGNIAAFHLIEKAKQLELPKDFISQMENDFKIGK